MKEMKQMIKENRAEIDKLKVSMATAAGDVKYIRKTLDEFIEAAKETYVTRSEFQPVRMWTYGTIGAIGMAAIGALLTHVVE